jgi:hypothetical protein
LWKGKSYASLAFVQAKARACGFILMFLAAGFSASAQESKFEPPLGSVFPLEQSPDSTRVLLARPLLLNHATILPAGTQVRTLYLSPQEGDADIKKNTQEALEATFSKQNAKVPRQEETASPVERAAYRRAYETVWSNPKQFRAQLQRLDEYQIRLVFSLPDSAEPVMQPFESAHGMVLDLEEGKPRVLSVLIDSPAHKNGIAAGWTVVSVEGQPVDSLETFSRLFQQALEKSKNQSEQLAMGFQVPGQAETRQIRFTPPRSLSSPTMFDNVNP